MIIIIYLYLLALGLVLGSFYNVVGLRVPKKESLIKPPSHCPQCGRRLAYRDLVPVFSWLFLKGQCRTCKAPIPAFYPIMELATGLLFVLMLWRFGLSGELFVALALVSLLIIITITDLKYMLIPDKILLFFSSTLYRSQHFGNPSIPGGPVFLVPASAFSFHLPSRSSAEGGWAAAILNFLPYLAGCSE